MLAPFYFWGRKEDMKKCSKCSQELPDEAIRCHNCGKKCDQGDSVSSSQPIYRCLNCGYQGPMNSYLRTNERQLIAIVLFCCGIAPGLIYLLWGSGKKACAKCQRTNVALL